MALSVGTVGEGGRGWGVEAEINLGVIESASAGLRLVRTC